MKRLSVVCLLFLFPVALGSAQTGKPIKVVEFTHLPFAYEDAQRKAARGVEIAYLKDLLHDLGYEPTFTFVPFPRMLLMLKSGEADMGSLLTKTPDREAFAYYSTQPVIIMIPQLVVRKDSPLKQLRRPSDLKGMKIGFAEGQTAPAFFKDSGLPPFDMVAGQELTQTNLKKLMAKRIDAFIALNPTNLMAASKELELTNAVRALDIPDPGTNFYIVISKKSNIASAILPALDAKLKAKKFVFDKYVQEELR